jgi:hypothetical protein
MDNTGAVDAGNFNTSPMHNFMKHVMNKYEAGQKK